MKLSNKYMCFDYWVVQLTQFFFYVNTYCDNLLQMLNKCKSTILVQLNIRKLKYHYIVLLYIVLFSTTGFKGVLFYPCRSHHIIYRDNKLMVI